MSFWKNKRVVVTGGASFIGSYLVDDLVARGAEVRVVDDLSSGTLENIEHHLTSGSIEFIKDDLRIPGVTRQAVRGMELVFHLAADHGGRGYLDTHQAGPASNLLLDGLLFWEAIEANVEKVIFASSGCEEVESGSRSAVGPYVYFKARIKFQPSAQGSLGRRI